MAIIQKLKDAIATSDLEDPRKEAFREAMGKLSVKDQEELAEIFAEMPGKIKYLCGNLEDKLVAIGNAELWKETFAREKSEFEEMSKES